MDINELIKRAWVVAEQAPIPDHVRSIAFEKALELLSCDVASRRIPSGSSPDASGSNCISTLAERLGITERDLEDVYSFDGETLRLVLAPRRLDTRASVATQELAVFVAGGRQLAGIEEWTAVNEIRRACSDFGRLDSGNFATSISKMDDVFGFQGRGRDRAVKLNRLGIARLRGLVERVTSSQVA